jgi:hypothetical protein
MLLLAGCAGERLQGSSPQPLSRDAERQHIIEQGQDFCQRHPDDIACPSKGKR